MQSLYEFLVKQHVYAYKYHPETKDELSDIIKERIAKEEKNVI